MPTKTEFFSNNLTQMRLAICASDTYAPMKFWFYLLASDQSYPALPAPGVRQQLTRRADRAITATTRLATSPSQIPGSAM
jgi:hypothetical protein